MRQALLRASRLRLSQGAFTGSPVGALLHAASPPHLPSSRHEQRRRFETKALLTPLAEPLQSLIPVAVDAATAASTTLAFTPGTAAIGGLILGSATLGRFALTGRILGISGILRGGLMGDLSAWRLTFLTGLASAGLLAAGMVPQAFEVLPESYSLARSVVAGLLVGFGASMGNGCTSGHGICGNSRLSARSAVYTVTFMLAGAASAMLTGTADALNVAQQAAPFVAPSPEVLHAGGLLICAAAATQVALNAAAWAMQSRAAAIALAGEYLSGLWFGLGLVVSGMVRPSKVAGFLSVLHPALDPSLMFVMGGALLLTTPGFQAILRGKALPHPACNSSFSCPTNNAIDKKLLLGGVLFGAGWGLGGICPGPALVAMAVPSLQLTAFVAAMAVAMVAEQKLAAALKY